MPVHRKVCTAERPFKPLPNSNGGASGGMTDDSTMSVSTKFSDSSSKYSNSMAGSKASVQSSGFNSKASAGNNMSKSMSVQKGSFGGNGSGGSTMSNNSSSKFTGNETSESYGSPYKSSVLKKPKTVMCYICGREFGTTSINIHIKAC